MAGGDKKHTPGEIKGYAQLLDRNAKHFDPIKEYAKEKGADTEGFQCGLLAALIPIVMAVGEFYEEVVEIGEEKLQKVAETTEAAAEKYEKKEKENSTILERIQAELDRATEGKV